MLELLFVLVYLGCYLATAGLLWLITGGGPSFWLLLLFFSAVGVINYLVKRDSAPGAANH